MQMTLILQIIADFFRFDFFICVNPLHSLDPYSKITYI